MDLVKFFVDEGRLFNLLDKTSLFELITNNGTYYLSISSDDASVGIKLYNNSLENEEKSYYEENEFEQIEDLEAGIYDFDVLLEDLFEIENINEIIDKEIFEKWSNKWM